MAAIPIFSETEQTGRLRHVSGAFQPSIKGIDPPGTILDASDAHILNLTGTPAGIVTLITVADTSVDQQVALINLTGSEMHFRDGGTAGGNNVAFGHEFFLPHQSAIVLYYETGNNQWYAAQGARRPAILLGGNYLDFNHADWETLPTGLYRMAGLGSLFTNPPVTLVPAADYDIYIEHSATSDIYGDQLIVTAVGDQDTANREFIRSGTSFAAALITDWDQYKFVGDTTPSDLVTYDNSGSSLVSILVKTALDELDNKIESVTEAYGGIMGVEDANLPDTLALTPAWTEYVPAEAPTYGALANVVAGANFGRLKIDYGGATVGTLGCSIVAMTSIDILGANESVEMGFMVDGVIQSDNIVTLRATTAGNHTTGLGFPMTFSVDLPSGFTDQEEVSIAFRSLTTVSIDLTSFTFSIRGAEPGKIGGIGSTDRRETRINGTPQTDRDAQNWMGSLLTYNDDGAGNEQEFTIDYPPEGTATFAATSVWDANTSPAVQLNVTGNTTLNLLAPPANDGRLFTLAVKQDGVGGHSVTLGTSFADTGTALILDTAANAVSLFVFYSTDSLLHQTAITTLFNDGEFLLAADARLKGDMRTRGYSILVEDAAGPVQTAYLGEGPGLVPTLESTGGNNLQITAAQTLNLTAGDSVIVSGDYIRLDATSAAQGLDLNTNNNRKMRLGAYIEINPSTTLNTFTAPVSQDAELRAIRGSDANDVDAAFTVHEQGGTLAVALGSFTDSLLRELRFNGNGSVVNLADTQTIDVNNFRFTRAAGADTFSMPTTNLPAGGALVADAAGLITVQTGVPSAPADPRIGTFSSSAGTVTVDLTDIEVAYVTCNEAAVTVTFTNGVDGKFYQVMFIDVPGSLVLTAGANIIFGTDITGFQTHGAAGEEHYYGVAYRATGNEYRIVAFSLGY